MNSRMLLGLAVLLVGVVSAVAGQGGKHRLAVVDGPAGANLPPMLPAVRQAILNEAAGATIDDCQRTTEEGETLYEVEITRSGVERSFAIGLDGGLRSRQYFLAELPAAVQQTIATLKARGEIGNIYWCNEAGDLVYEVELGKGAGRRFYSIAPDGTHLSTQYQLAELPEAAQKTIREQAGAEVLASISRDETEVGEVFDAVLLRDGRRHIVSVNAAGVVVATQILLLQAPAAVQDTITKVAGNAQIIYVGECVEEGATVYVVITMQGLRRGEFVVDAGGSLLARVIAMAALPEPAQKYLRAQAAGARIARIEQLPDGTFSADLDRNGKKQVLTFSAAGAKP